MKFGNVLAMALVVLVLGACAKVGAIEVGQEAPDFTLKDLNGNAVRLSEFKGKVIILDFFASWCPPCREEIPDFIDLQNSYGARGFSLIGVSLVDSAATKKFAEEFGINYTVMIDDDSASTIYGPIRSIPTTFVIDKNFKIAKMYIGYRPKGIFENDVKELLK